MKTSTIVWIVVIVVIILGGIWWYFESSSSTAPAPATTTTTTNTVATPVISVATNPTLGTVLVAQNGMTLYTYDKDTNGVSNCTGACLTEWPAYTPTAGAALSAGPGATGTVSTIVRTDNGATQLTYNGMPLYFFANDTAPGDANGQNEGGFTVAQP